MSSKQFIDDSALFEDDFDAFDDEVIPNKSDSQPKKEPVIKNIEEKPPIKIHKEEVTKEKKEIQNNIESKIKDDIKNPEVEIRVKPKLEIKEEKVTNPYENRYERTKPVNATINNRNNKRNSSNNAEKVAVKKLISISQKNLKVLEILNRIKKDYPSDSEFICQAIIEKYEREKENSSKDLKDLVKDVLEDLVGEKFIILKSSADLAVSTQPVPNVSQESINHSIKGQEKEENKSLLKGIMSNWDMDDEDDM